MVEGGLFALTLFRSGSRSFPRREGLALDLPGGNRGSLGEHLAIIKPDRLRGLPPALGMGGLRAVGRGVVDGYSSHPRSAGLPVEG